jgi:hypothetical protein
MTPNSLNWGVPYTHTMPVRLSLVTLLSVLLVAGHSPAEVEDWRWVTENFPAALDTLMPLKQRTGTHITYRSNRDYQTDVLEYSFRIANLPSKNGVGLESHLSAIVRIAESKSIHVQLMEVHRSAPKLRVEEVSNRIKVKESRLTEMECPAIRRQHGALSKLRFGINADNQYVINHPMIHRFYIQTLSQEVEMVLFEEDHPLTAWAVDTRKEIQKCIDTRKTKSD